MIALAFACGPGYPGLTSWGILSRPFGTGLGEFVYPGLTSWAILSRPCGTDRDKARADLFSASALQTGRINKVNLDKTDSQPSLRDSIW